jgi:tRNA(Ile)-lysidine synthase
VLLASLVRRLGAVRVRAVHVDHALHAESAAWAAHCRTVARSLHVEIDVVRIAVPARGNREAAARRARYRVLRDRLGPLDCVVLAHHADDQAETLLWRLVRGRTPRGMPARRPLGAGRLVRPFLGLPRTVLDGAATALGVPWIEDPSNRDLTMDRNFLRQEILPRLRARFPDVVARLAAQAEHLAREETMARVRADVDAADWPAGVLPWAALRDSGARRGVARRYLERQGCASVSEHALAEIERQLDAGRRARLRVQLGAGIWLVAGAQGLEVRRTLVPSTFDARPWVLAAPIAVGPFRLAARWLGAGPPPDVVLDVRPRAGGERLRPAGRGGSRSVKRLLQEAGVPLDRRRNYPLLYESGSLVVVPGVAVDESVAARFATGGARGGARAFVITIET